MSSPLERVLSAIGDYTGKGPRYRARCPAHDGHRKDSLGITEMEGGAVWLNHFCGCDKRDILNALRLDWPDLFPEGHAKSNSHKSTKSTRRQRESEADTLARTLAVEQILGLITGPTPVAVDLEAVGMYACIVEHLWGVYAEQGTHEAVRVVWEGLRGDLKEAGAKLLQAVDARRSGPDKIPNSDDSQADPNANPWTHIKSAPAFLAEPEVPFEGLAKDLLAPGAISIMSAPKGLGKTQVALNLGVALATGGIFRGEVVKPVRVLVLDRDNPEAVLKQRLRNWGAATAERLHVLTRRHAPDLKDREAWAQFPLDDYDVLILDAVGSFTEGITEKEGRLTTEVLATLLDLARRGIAILLLNNVTKDGANFKGREEWADRVDIMYEVRDATGFTPSGKGDWWMDLPASGEAAWAERAQRRKGTVTFRLAFIPSKFRLGPEPDPFVLELHLPPEGLWTMKDVTSALIQAGEEAQREAIEAKKAQREAAAQALAEKLSSGPLNKTDAETFFREEGIGRNEARQMFKEHTGTLWIISAGEGKGAPQILFKMGGGVNGHNVEPLGDKALPGEHFRQIGTQGGANGASAEPLPESPVEDTIFSATESRPQKLHPKEVWPFGHRERGSA